jgi:hypothetical protein
MQGKVPVLVRTNGSAYHFDTRTGRVRKLLPAQAKEVQETFADLTAFIKEEEREIQLDPIMKPEWTAGDTDLVVTKTRTAEGNNDFDDSDLPEGPRRGRRNLKRRAKTDGVAKLRMHSHDIIMGPY